MSSTPQGQAIQPEPPIGSVPLHRVDSKEEEGLSKTSRQESCISTSTLAPSNTHTMSSRNEKRNNEDRDREKKPSKSFGQRLDHAILNLAPAFFSLNMVRPFTQTILMVIIADDTLGHRYHINLTVQTAI